MKRVQGDVVFLNADEFGSDYSGNKSDSDSNGHLSPKHS